MSPITTVPTDTLLLIFSFLPMQDDFGQWRVNREFRCVIELEPYEEVEATEEEEPLNQVGKSLWNLWNDFWTQQVASSLIKIDDTKWKKHFRIDIGPSPALPKALFQRLFQRDPKPADPNRPYIYQTHMLIDVPVAFTAEEREEKTPLTLRTFESLLERNRPHPFQNAAGEDIAGSVEILLQLQVREEWQNPICFTGPAVAERILTLDTLSLETFDRLTAEGFTHFRPSIPSALVDVPLTRGNFENLITLRLAKPKEGIRLDGPNRYERAHYPTMRVYQDKILRERIWWLIKIDQPLEDIGFSGMNVEHLQDKVQAYGRQMGGDAEIAGALIHAICATMHVLETGKSLGWAFFSREKTFADIWSNSPTLSDRHRLLVGSQNRHTPRIGPSYTDLGIPGGVAPAQCFVSRETVSGDELAALFS